MFFRRKILPIVLVSMVAVFGLPVLAQHDTSPLIGVMWNETDRKILTKTIDKDEAVELLKEYEEPVKAYFRKMGGSVVRRSDWVFPLKNYSSISYRDGGNDYLLGDYDYFQGSNTKGHPAHDIMIADDDKDLLDDVTGKRVDVVSMGSGVVISVDTTWEPGSKLRGGKFVKIFDVNNDGIFYYSHLSVVNVYPGQIVNAGEKIGEVGRTGRKTILPGGKTHLHVGFLQSEDGYPVPEQIIEDLKKAEGKKDKSKD
jgi:hypothetical protein